MWEEIKTFLLIAIPILTGLSGIGLQRWWVSYKLKRFKLIDHPIFTDLVLSIRDLKMWCPGKNRQVFVDALIVKFHCWIIEGKTLADDLQKNKYSNLQLKNKLLLWVAEVANIYTTNWTSDGIPPKIVERLTTVLEINIQTILKDIKSITYNNDMYPIQRQKIIAIFDALKYKLIDTKSDFYKLVYREKYNGDFAGIKYKGIPINDSEYEKYNITIKNK